MDLDKWVKGVRRAKWRREEENCAGSKIVERLKEWRQEKDVSLKVLYSKLGIIELYAQSLSQHHFDLYMISKSSSHLASIVYNTYVKLLNN